MANLNTTRGSVLVLLILSLALLIPGLFAPVLTIRGVITREGIAQMAPVLLERGLDDNTVKTLKSMMNPQMVTMIETFGGAPVFIHHRLQRG